MQWAAVAELLEFDRRAILAGEWWRLWTCHLAHYSPQHALIDCATVLAAGVIVTQTLGWRRLCGALLITAPLIAAGLLVLAPDCLYYRGASGLAVMLIVLAGGALWHRMGACGRVPLLLMAFALLAKIAAEAGGYAAPWSDLPDDVRIAWQAHLLGMGCGVIFAAKWK